MPSAPGGKPGKGYWNVKSGDRILSATSPFPASKTSLKSRRTSPTKCDSVAIAVLLSRIGFHLYGAPMRDDLIALHPSRCVSPLTHRQLAQDESREKGACAEAD